MDLARYADSNVEMFPPGKLFRICFDPVTASFRMFSTDQSAIETLSKTYSCQNKAAFYSKLYGYDANDRIYVFNKFGFFPTGFIWEILGWIKRTYGTLSCVAISKNCMAFLDDFLANLKPIDGNCDADSFELSNVAQDSGRNEELASAGKQPFLFRDYQENAIKALLLKGKGRGMVELPTASGKSFMIANLIWNIEKKFKPGCRYLIFVPNKQLVEQFYKDLLDYGYRPSDVTRFTAGLKKNEKFDPKAWIIVANRQYVFTNKAQLPKIDAIVCDEIHQCANPKSETFQFIQNLACPIKIGCSGTIPRDNYGRWSLMGLIGRILYVEDICTLQKRGFLSKLKITLVDVKDKVVESNRNLLFNTRSLRRYNAEDPDSDIAFNDAYNDELKYIEKNFVRLYEPVLSLVEKMEDNVLLLFDRIEFGKSLFEYAKEKNIRGSEITYIDGTIDVKEREKIREAFESGGNNILFAQSACMSTGVNIKRLTNVVYCFSTKGFSKVLQSIGRTLRLHAEKKEARLFDVSFNFKYSRKHLRERLKIYADMYGKKKPDEVVKFEVL